MDTSDLVKESNLTDVHLMHWEDGEEVFKREFISLPEHCSHRQATFQYRMLWQTPNHGVDCIFCICMLPTSEKPGSERQAINSPTLQKQKLFLQFFFKGQCIMQYGHGGTGGGAGNVAGHS